MNIELDNKYTEFSNILFEIKGTLDVYKIVSLNAKQINAKGYDSFFYLFSELAIKNYTTNICKLFEKQNQRYELNSIFGILSYIKKQGISPLSPSVLDDYIKDKDVTDNLDQGYIDKLENILNLFCEDKKDTLKRYRHFRDKKIAHTESIEDEIKNLPSFDEMEQLFTFCFEFVRTISSAYLQVGCHRHDNDNRFHKSLCKLLTDAGMEEIIADFPD